MARRRSASVWWAVWVWAAAMIWLVVFMVVSPSRWGASPLGMVGRGNRFLLVGRQHLEDGRLQRAVAGGGERALQHHLDRPGDLERLVGGKGANVERALR